MTMSFGEIMQLIAGILIVILAAYYATYFLANKKRKRLNGRAINIRERFALSKDKMVCVIESNGKAYLVVITNGGATLLDTTELDEAETETAEKSTASPQNGYQPNGLIATGIWKLFNSVKGATTAKTPATKREERAFSSVLEESSEKPTILVAREEDAMDEIQRRLNKRKAAGASADTEEGFDDE